MDVSRVEFVVQGTALVFEGDADAFRLSGEGVSLSLGREGWGEVCRVVGLLGGPEVAASNRGKPWAADDDARLLAAFDEGVEPAELATRFRRSRGAILARLALHDRLPEGATRFPVGKRPADDGTR